MQTSEIGIRLLRTRPGSDQGFTLIEVLLVVFIIGLASSVVVGTLPSRPAAVQEESIRLERTIDDLSARSVLSGGFYALDVSLDGYTASRWVEGAWLPLNNGSYVLPDEVRISVRGEQGDDDQWRLTFDPAGLPLETFIELRQRGDVRQIERVRDDVGERRR